LQLLAVLLKAQAGGLFFELKLGNAAAQGLKLALKLQAAFVTGAQFGGEVIVLAALGGQVFFAGQFAVECILQTALGGCVAQTLQLGLSTHTLVF